MTIDIIKKYIAYFEKRGHKQIPNASLVPENDPSTLFTSSGMQPLVPYLLGEPHPLGKRLVNVQNSFRAQDIDEIGDNRHITFFRMLGNWSLGDYFKTDQLTWFFDFLIDPKEGLRLDPHRLYVSVFAGNEDIVKDSESIQIWETLFQNVGIKAKVGKQEDTDARIFPYGVEKNWWSRAGTPGSMPPGEPGGPDSEVFYDFGAELKIHENSSFKNEICHVNCDCGRYLEIGNSVFMQYKKTESGFEDLPQKNVDFGGGLERLLAAAEDKQDIFKTSLFKPIIRTIEQTSGKKYRENFHEMRIIADHFIASTFIAGAGVYPSNKEQGYILRRLLRRSFDNFYLLNGKNMVSVIESIVDQYRDTDIYLFEKYEHIKNVILEEEQKYEHVRREAKKFVQKRYGSGLAESHSHPSPLSKREGTKSGDELMGITEISADDAFTLYTTHGLSPTQIKSLGYMFDHQAFADKMEEHQKLSRTGASKKFAGGLADNSELTIKGHTATHLMHQALRDVLGDKVHQSGSNITSERVRFDYNFDRKLTSEEIKKVEDIVNEKIHDNLPVHFEFMPLARAKEIGAIGLFDEKYGDTVKIYFIGGGSSVAGRDEAYSVEFCGGPHVDSTGAIKSFKIIKEEGLGRGMRRIYAVVN